MHLKIQKRKGRAYLSVIQNYRENGTVKSRTIETIGYADAYKDRYDDPIAYFRAYVEQRNREESARNSIDLTFDVAASIDTTSKPPARLGASIALGCLDALGANAFFRAQAGRTDMAAHTGRVFEMLATERMMHVTSKRESWTARRSFPRACDFSFGTVYEALPCIARERESIGAQMLRAWRRIGGETDTSRVYLICGSYAFPVDGGSKRASIAIALDGSSMPLGFHQMEGRLGPEAFQEAASELKERLGAGRAIVVAGGLRDLDPSISQLAQSGDGFVFYQRNFHEQPELASWAEEEDDYQPMGADVLMKERVAKRELSDGSSISVREVMLRGGGYATSHSQALLVSSELDLSGVQIVQLYRELWRQAEPFQPLEADFSSMPRPISAHDHIAAHFVLCYAAFAALRLLRWKMDWKYNAADTADALLRMEGVHLQRNFYLFSYRSEVTDCIEGAVGLDQARRLRTRADMRGIPSHVSRTLLP